MASTQRRDRFHIRFALAAFASVALAACNSTDAPTPPAAPAAIAAVPDSDHQVTLTWGLADQEATEVKVERADATGVFVPVTTLPANASRFIDSGLLAGTLYQYRVQACKPAACSTFTGPVQVSTHATLLITTTALPNAVRGQAYSAGLSASGADTVYTWSVDAGSLPGGLSLSTLGIISGTPTAEQVGRFTARVRSGDGQTAVRDFTISVNPPATGPTFAIHNAVLPPALSNQTYQPLLTTQAGDGSTVTWTIISGSLPSGISLGSGGGFGGRSTAVGTYPITVRATTALGLVATKSYSLAVVPDDTGRFNITRLDVATVPADIAPSVAAAIARWENVIRGDLSRDDIPRGFFSASQCEGFGEATNGTWVDDVIIMVDIGPIDGPNKILGQASPCAIRDNILTEVGILTLDSEDLSRYVGTQTLVDIIFHEIGHILGFGTLWSGFDCPPTSGFTTCWTYLTGSGTADPRFTGLQAVAEWQALGGTGMVPVENMGGSGTADSHWRESVFKTEIMTGFVSPTGASNPLSRVTIASLADLGYTVNFAAADAFSITLPAALRTAGDEQPWEDVGREPILVNMPDGTKRTIPR